MAYRETLSPESPHWEKCARHERSQTSRNLVSIYLCDDCTRRLVARALNERPPVYHGETVDGYCGLCNDRKQVTLRQWFICFRCWPVVKSYQKAVAPPQALRSYWIEHVVPVAPHFELTETDEVVLAPYRVGGKTKRAAAEELEDSDFLVSELTSDGPMPRFHIELKAGPGSIETMREFQLDVNDFNDIVGVTRNNGRPVYVFHVQLDSQYLPPTRRTLHAGLWWSDIYTMREHTKRVARRRDESKQAVYFNTAAFQPVETFLPEVTERRFETLARRVAEAPPEYLP